MIPGDLAGLYYFPPEVTPSMTTGISVNDDHYQYSNVHCFPDNYMTNLSSGGGYYGSLQFPTAAASTASSASEEEQQEQQQMRVMIDERRQRRMISNRESARRSRMRKQKHLDELWAQVVRLRSENHGLIDKLNRASDCHDQVLRENARLKAEASDLRLLLSRLRLPTDHDLLIAAADDDDRDVIACNAAHLRAEASTNSMANTSKNSVGLLH